MLVRKDFGSVNTGNEGFKLRLSYDMICPLMASDTFTCESMIFSQLPMLVVSKGRL